MCTSPAWIRWTSKACYRAMDWLLQIGPALAKQAYHRVTDLLNLEVDLLFFDTTSTYVEIDDADEPVAHDEHGRARPDPDDPDAASRKGFRAYGNSKDHRDDLPPGHRWDGRDPRWDPGAGLVLARRDR